MRRLIAIAILASLVALPLVASAEGKAASKAAAKKKAVAADTPAKAEAEPAAAAPTTPEAAPAKEPEPPKAKPVDLGNEVADLRKDIAGLRDELAKLKQALDGFMSKTATDLRSENERLRQEVRRLYKEGNIKLPNVPMPDRALLEQAVAQPDGSQPAEGKAEPGGAPKGQTEPGVENAPKPEEREINVNPAPSGELAYDVVAEWGRSPDEAAKLAKKDPKATSLKGMICVVAKDPQDEPLTALARSLREQCEGFDNINIEVFDDAAAARAYNENRRDAPKHRVLSISKHKGSGRDVILLIRGEKAQQVPIKP